MSNENDLSIEGEKDLYSSDCSYNKVKLVYNHLWLKLYKILGVPIGGPKVGKEKEKSSCKNEIC